MRKPNMTVAKITLLCTVAVVMQHVGCEDYNPLSLDAVRVINDGGAKKALWKAGLNFHPSTPMSYIRNLMGTILETPKKYRLPLREDHDLEGLLLPDDYDPREKYPYCSSLREVRDQGGVWELLATEAMTDRLCIATKGKSGEFRFSAENLVSCCGILSLCGFGCNGGFPSSAWRYLVSHGIVSGGGYGEAHGCQSYEIPPCEHHVPGPRPNCTNGKTPKCHKVCDNGYSVPYKQDLHFGEKSYGVRGNVEQIQAEILRNGPVEAAMVVYDDLLVYKSGVYHHVKGFRLGGHAVKILGWGVDRSNNASVPYWLVANSWNYDWGDGGFFKILRGGNECGIESLGVVAGVPKI